MPGGKKREGHPEVWAFLTIITFPIVLVATDIIGAKGLWPFVFAILATFSILILEAIVRGQLWPFEEKFVKHISHPDTPIRILLFMGAVLLLLETALIYAVTIDRGFDVALLELVTKKQCSATRDPASIKLCNFLQRPYIVAVPAIGEGNLSGYAIRKYAVEKWFPKDELATCSDRNVENSYDQKSKTLQELHLVHCTAWKVNENGELKSRAKKTSFVGVKLAKLDNGQYQVSAWSEDPNGEQWTNALGEIAEKTRVRVIALAILPEFEKVLQEEAKTRAQDLLKK